MPIPWDESASPFFQQTPGFPGGIRFAGAIPGYGSVKPNRPALKTGGTWPTFKQEPYPAAAPIDPKAPYSTIGLDTSTGQRDTERDSTSSTGQAVPDLGLDQLLRYQQAAFPYQLEAQRQAAELSASLTKRQLEDLMGPLDVVGWRATQRNLLASQAYRRFAEQMPSNIQKIAESKTGQMTATQAGEATLMDAVRAQQQAATVQGSLAPYYGQARFA